MFTTCDDRKKWQAEILGGAVCRKFGVVQEGRSWMAERGVRGRKLRVCFFIPDFNYGGAQKQCILLLNELQRRDDIELTLVRFRPGAQDHLLDTANLRNVFVDVRSNFDARAVIALARLVSQSHTDLIVSWVRVCDVYSYFVRLLRPRVKWVMTQRNSHHMDSWLFRLRDFLGRRANAIAANSPGGVQWWEDRRARGRVYLVDNVAASVKAVPEQPRDACSVLYVGRLEAQKNVLSMVRAFVRLAQSQNEVVIRVCGDGALRAEMEKIVADAGVADRIEFLGFRKDATDWMAGAKVLVSLSEHEGMPNVLMEGVQAGCSIVASSIPEHVDFLGSSYPFLVQDYHNVDEAAGVMEQALGLPINSGDLEHARQHLSRMEPPAVAARYMHIFSAVAAGETRMSSG